MTKQQLQILYNLHIADRHMKGIVRQSLESSAVKPYQRHNRATILSGQFSSLYDICRIATCRDGDKCVLTFEQIAQLMTKYVGAILFR